MIIKKLSLILFVLSVSDMHNAAYKFSSPKYIQKLVKPPVFKKYPMPKKLSMPQITALLQKQPLPVQNQISQHPFYKELIIEVNNPVIVDYITPDQPIFDTNFLIKQEIFIYCLQHPQDAEEIMNFYQEMKDAQQLIEDRLQLLPPHAQRFFKEQVQKYLDSDVEYDKTSNINNIKAKISRLYPYAVTALKLGFSILMLTLLFCSEFYILDYINHYQTHYKTTEPLNLEDPQEQKLLEIFNLLVEALNLEPTTLRKTSDSKNTADFVQYINCIRLSPLFFQLSLDLQIFILLHELRHYQQYTQIIIPKDIIKYAKECGVETYNFEFLNFLRFGFFTSSAMIEFDADLSAARHMKDYSSIQPLALEYRGSQGFDPSTGYLSREMILKESPHANSIARDIEKQWYEFVDSLPNENVYLKFVPQHLQEAAVKNKKAKAEAKQIFEEYREF